MKKLITVLLAALMCLTLAACGGSSPKKAIVGEWKNSLGETFVFNSDGTFVYSDKNLTWKYDKELERYVVDAAGMSINFKIEEKDGLRYFRNIWFSQHNYYHSEDFEKGFELDKQAAQEKFNGYLDGKTKIEIGKSYTFVDGISVRFTGAKIQENETGTVCLEAAFTNDSSDIIKTSDSMQYKTYMLYKDVEASEVSWGGENWNDGHDFEFAPGETVNAEGRVYEISYLEPLETDKSQVNALVYCFEMNGIEYYADITEYIK